MHAVMLRPYRPPWLTQNTCCLPSAPHAAVACHCRDEALLELQNAYSDVEAMQATLADSALYVRQLRRRIVELEVWQQQTRAQHQQQQQQGQHYSALKQGMGGDGQQDKDQGACGTSLRKFACYGSVTW